MSLSVILENEIRQLEREADALFQAFLDKKREIALKGRQLELAPVAQREKPNKKHDARYYGECMVDGERYMTTYLFAEEHGIKPQQANHRASGNVYRKKMKRIYRREITQFYMYREADLRALFLSE